MKIKNTMKLENSEKSEIEFVDAFLLIEFTMKNQNQRSDAKQSVAQRPVSLFSPQKASHDISIYQRIQSINNKINFT